MTKHLRLIMLSLLAMICLGGYSQSEMDFTTVTSLEFPYTFGKYTMNAEKGNGNSATPTFYINEKKKIKGEIRCYAKNTMTISAKDGKMVKIVFVLSTQGKAKCSKPTVDNGTVNRNPADGEVSEVIWENSDGSASVTFTIGSKIDWGTATSGAGQLCFNKIVITDASSTNPTTPTTTTFGAEYDGKTFTFVDGVLEGWKAPTATHTPADVAGTTAYKSDNEAVATVEANGQLTFKGYGTAKITATFTPKETETYAESTASYTITNIKSKYYATVADLRKDLNNGTLTANDEVAVKLTDAKVLYVNQWTSNKVDHTQYFVREGNAAISFYDTDIKMSKSAVVNGTFMGKIGSLTGLLVLTKNNNTNPADLQVKTSTKPAEPIEISTDDIANYVCDLVTVKGATVIGGTECALFNGKNLMPLYYNKFFPRTTSLEAPYDDANVDLTSAIVLTYVNKQNELVYELAPTDKYSLVYNLSEESVNAIAAKTDVAVSLKRTFYKDGGWNTLCLPFAVNATDFEGAEVREVDVTQSSENAIVFKEATTIKAGKPYLIKWAKTPNEVCDFVNTFEGVTLVATAAPVKVNDAITFTGFYNKATADKLGASVAAIGAGNKLFKVTSGEMKGFRAAFVLNPATPAAGIKVVIDGTTTGIEDLVVDGVKANGRVYNLNGQYVGNSLNGLQPGIYIQNGKKIVVK